MIDLDNAGCPVCLTHGAHGGMAEIGKTTSFYFNYNVTNKHYYHLFIFYLWVLTFQYVLCKKKVWRVAEHHQDHLFHCLSNRRFCHVTHGSCIIGWSSPVRINTLYLIAFGTFGMSIFTPHYSTCFWLRICGLTWLDFLVFTLQSSAAAAVDQVVPRCQQLHQTMSIFIFTGRVFAAHRGCSCSQKSGRNSQGIHSSVWEFGVSGERVSVSDCGMVYLSVCVSAVQKRTID